MSNTTPFLFDDFFASDDDPGLEIPVTIKGRQVPIRIKRGISVADKAAIEARAMKYHIDGGKIVLDGMDELAMMEEMLVATIKSWPFVHQDGTPVEITRDNVRRLLGGAEELVAAISKIDREGEEALAPFAPPSAEA